MRTTNIPMAMRLEAAWRACSVYLQDVSMNSTTVDQLVAGNLSLDSIETYTFHSNYDEWCASNISTEIEDTYDHMICLLKYVLDGNGTPRKEGTFDE